ncbi:hypothetical protein [Kordiimonas aquimaris]|uniref:hypothetical protein n=1 Tax=Kordiimonas aquimaris TaxID=707591 RepID=UPI0021D17E38|nr:hypothetical protein [Kordiimonas aquimaris]
MPENTKQLIADAYHNISDVLDESELTLPQLDDSVSLYDEANVLSQSFNPFEVDLLLEEVFGHLNTCLSVHQSALVMAEKAVSFAISQSQEKQKVKALEEHLSYLNSPKALAYTSGKINQQTKLVMEGEHAQGEAASVAGALSDTEARLKVTEEEIRIKKQLQRSLREQATRQGSPLNYPERYKKEKQVFVGEFKKLLAKSLAIAVGIDTIFDIKLPVPDAGADLLHRLNTWYNEVVAELEKEMSMQQVLNFKLPISERYKYAFNDCPALIDSDASTFGAQRNAGTLEFTIPEELFAHFKNIRLLSVGLRAFVSSQLGPKKKRPPRSEMISCILKPPSQKLSNGYAIELQGHPLELYTNINLHTVLDGETDAYFNINPVGEWEVKLPKTSTWNAINREWIGNMHIEIKVIAAPESSQ